MTERKYTPYELEKIMALARVKEAKMESTENEPSHTEQDIIDSVALSGIKTESIQAAISEYKAAQEKPHFLQQAYQWTKGLSKSVKMAAVGLLFVSPGLGLSYSLILEPWWNSGKYAMERLAKYKQTHIFRDPQERAQIVSDLDEIIEEHHGDFDSDYCAAWLFTELSQKFPVRSIARIANIIGGNSSRHCYYITSVETKTYLEFISNNNISQATAESYLNLSASTSKNAKMLVDGAIKLLQHDFNIPATENKTENENKTEK